ncbi:AcrR family transcriptional regulator [Thermocatellispora tengchongensis]|uniref:AcrR family transcriptional regulator n=1 Tax=Thermocatellispora tengchongensis TaxID=1073253 RepID=A0A840PE36_9ACTN|nr:TetR/AcrR family transcriptional regulator [Thermocatellispora tengchongensis]MBB5134305.1 AcrR family transcriptional regulator [Thermocatellispora tengchongensis]
MTPRKDLAERNDRALLQAARDVLAEDGAHASVAAIAARAGVGIGSLYRRYRTKEELFQRLSVLSLDHWNRAAEEGLADPDPWAGLAGFVRSCVEFGQGSLAPIAGTIEVTEEMSAKSRRGDELLRDLVRRAHEAGVLRPDVTAVDISLLIEQMGRSPLVDQLRKQARDDLLPAAFEARRRLIAIVLDGLRPGRPALPGSPPGEEMFTGRWAPDAAAGTSPA